MEKTIFTVSYPGDFPNENFSTKASARRYLIAEAKAYKDFLSFLRKARGLETIRCSYGGSVSGEFLADSFLRLLEALDDPKSFHNLQALYSGNLVALPPSSQSMEGRLILGLMNNQRRRAAVDVYLWFTNLRDVINVRGDHQIAPYVENGQKLVTSAIACEALPFRAETSQRLAGAMRRAENQSKTLQEEVQAAQQINHDHENALTEYREQLDTRSKRIEQIFVKRERRRQSQHKASIELFRGTILGQDDEARKANKLSLLKSKQQRERQEEEFRKLQDRFYSHMKLRAPVKLWEGRVEEHRSNARTALTTFCVIGFLAVLAGALVPWFLGDYIAASFVTEVCQGEGSDSCTREFSAKGPLTIAGLLLVMSLTLWVIRLQYRVYLSERHLSLDAHEKRAFTETYLAMKEGRDVGANNEAIVLAALFRPTQDGIIRDDDSTLDLSAAALFAKQLSRNA